MAATGRLEPVGSGLDQPPRASVADFVPHIRSQIVEEPVEVKPTLDTLLTTRWLRARTYARIRIPDFRSNLFNRLEMRLLLPNLPGPNNDLSDQIEHYVARVTQEPDAQIYAFGQRWGPEEDRPDKVFGFTPGNGIHDIHMNQGNDPSHTSDDGVWQDGALLFAFPGSQQWVAVFLAFQSQAWHTDDRTGNTSLDVPNPGPGSQPSPTEPDHLVRIVGALVNPVGPTPEQETVTLINASPASVNLAGWKIADRLKRTHTLSGVIAPGATLMVTLSQDVHLGNQGGILTLLNSKGLKVDGVSYTAQQAQKEGWTIVF